MESILGKIKFAEVAPSAAKGNPSVSVRANGVLVSNAQAEALVGANVEGKNIFKVGTLDNGVIVLIPATNEDANVVKATKNGDKFQFKQVELFKGLGAAVKDRYAVTKGTDGEGEEAVTYFLLTPAGKTTDEESAASPEESAQV